MVAEREQGGGKPILGDALGAKVAQPLCPTDPAPVRTGHPYVTPLKELCVEVVAQHFEANPTFGKLPALYVKRVVDLLALDLPLELAGTLIEDESYWKRRSCLRWKSCEVDSNGRSWKQLYFERNLEGALESYDPAVSDPNELKRLLTFSKRFIRRLNVMQLPAHVDLQMLFHTTASCLTSLSLRYGMDNVGMDYDRSLFGMKLSDCRSLAKAIERAETLIYLNLSGNLLDDDKVRMVASGLVDNMSVVHLDLSHNMIADRGVRALAKLLDNRSVISYVDLSDNQIHTEGGRALARSLRSNHSVLTLSLRLNRLGDEGGKAICDVLRSNQTLQKLNVGANSLGPQSAAALASLIKTNRALIQLDVSGNAFGPEGGQLIRDALEHNTVLRSMDVRMCGVGEELEAAIADACKANAEATDFGNMYGAGTLTSSQYLDNLNT